MSTENEPGGSSRENQLEVLKEGPVSPAHLAPILQNVAEGVVSVNRNQEIVFFNRGARDIFGYRAEEVMGQALDILLPERFWLDHRKHVDTFERTGVTARRMAERLEVVGRRKNGEEFPAEASITHTRGADQHLLTALVRDVTEQKKLEAELERQAETLRRRHPHLFGLGDDGHLPVPHPGQARTETLGAGSLRSAGGPHDIELPPP